MTDQGHLFTITYNQEPTTTQPETPTCPGCRLRPARWNHKRNEHSRYCHGTHCSNSQRKCLWCGATYNRDSPTAGTKYCRNECKAEGYQIGQSNSRTQMPCALCGRQYRGTPKAIAQICTNCAYRYASQIRVHKLNTTWAKRLIEAVTCDACNERLGSKSGKHIGQVDHDHNCCRGSTSCGQCVRGIICGRCNALAGYIEHDATRFAAVLTYIQRDQ